MNKKNTKLSLSFLERSQKKIDELKKKLNNLSRREELPEEAPPLKSSDHPAAKEVKVIISVESVIKSTMAIFLLIALVNLLGIIKNTIIVFLVALFLATTLRPAVDKLERWKLPRGLGIILLYILILGVFITMFSSLVPIIATQIEQLALSVRDMLQNLINNPNPDSWFMQKIQPLANQLWLNIDQTQVVSHIANTLKGIASQLTSFAGNAIGAVFTIFNGLFNLILVLIVTFFMITHSKDTSHFFYSLFPKKYSDYISVKSRQISLRMGEWIRGQLLLALAMGLLTFIVLSIMGLNYALTLALLSAVAEFIPYLGPIITFASAALIALNQNPVLILWLIPAYAIIQFLEGNVLNPLIVGRAIGMNPIVIIFALLCGATIGAKIGGSFGLSLVGMIIAVPIANIISIFVEDYTTKKR